MSIAAPPVPLSGPLAPTRSAGDGPLIVIPPTAHTLAGFRAWYASDDFPEEGRIEFLAGEIIIDMGHERVSSHVSLKGEFARALITLAKELNLGQFFTDGVRVVNEDANLSNEPDGCLVTWEAVRSRRVRLQQSRDGEDETEVVGSPDMVVEIVSPSSVRMDTVRLPELYHRAGIREYWLVDARGDDIAFTIFRHAPSGYQPAGTTDGWLSSDVFGRQMRLERSETPIGTWDYHLLVHATA
jgi:Uma2 family endonuclease